VLANGSLSSQQSGEGDIRKRLVDEDLVDCVVALPGQLFYSTGIPVCLWFLAKNKASDGFRDRRKETLFINATKLGFLEDRTHRQLTQAEVGEITGVYHRWRGTQEGLYADVAGFCRAASTAEIAKSDYVLTPGRYCGAEAVEADGEPFREKFARLTMQLEAQFEESDRLQTVIRENCKRWGRALSVYETATLGLVLGSKGYIRGPFGSALKRGELQTFGFLFTSNNTRLMERETFATLCLTES
jgi:type I restriction enzyme M protein